MIIKPTYIPIEHIQNQPRSYEWDDWDPYEALGEPESNLVDRLSMLTNRAIFSFTIGCVEWVVYRFSELQSDLRPFEYIEALWVAEMDNDIQPPFETNEEEWEGSVLAPVDLAIITVLNCMNNAEVEAPDVEAGLSDLIVRFILPNDEAYLKWRDTILLRLESLYPRSKNNEWGEAVPREALDPNILLNNEVATKFVTNFLEKDFSKNKLIIKPMYK